MKIDRLLGILSILMQEEKVTAPFLAERFEVSRRTINRDVEDLCKAGIPLVTMQGAGGGISVMEGYRIDRTLFTRTEMEAILTGLKSLDSVSDDRRYQRLMDKLAVRKGLVSGDDGCILINLSSYYKSTLTPKMELIQNAIHGRQKIVFDYFGPKEESVRRIEPYRLVFQWSGWYVWGFCEMRQDYRLFKLNRMLNLDADELFELREIPEYQMEIEMHKAFPEVIEAEIVFDRTVKWRLIDEYGVESFVERQDGKLLFHFGFADEENLLGWLLSFGSKAELLKPKPLRAELAGIFSGLYQRYQNHDL